MPGKQPHRCEYRQGRQRCRRDGTGNPCLCPPHRREVEAAAREAEAPAGTGALGDLISDFFGGARITREKVAAAINEAAWSIGGAFGAHFDLFEIDVENDTYDPNTGTFPHEHANRQRPPHERVYSAPPDELAERRAAIRKAKLELGFAASEPVTLDQIKTRHRELARKHHPDRGGSVDKMQRINAAVDILEKSNVASG